jgi:DNA-binding PadR family transcriptional regulator
VAPVEEIQLTPTSYVVLGLLSLAGEATSYDLKRLVAESVGYFWALPHSQLYAEPARLAKGGYVSEKRETSGRRRRHYSLTEKGRGALEDWAGALPEELGELRDPGILKLFFGADPPTLARSQLELHGRRLREYEEMLAGYGPHLPPGPRLALEAGIGHEREYLRFWRDLAGS